MTSVGQEWIWSARQRAAIVPDLMKYEADAAPFKPFMLHQNVTESVKLLDWWKSQADRVKSNILSVLSISCCLLQLHLLALRESFHHLAWYTQTC